MQQTRFRNFEELAHHIGAEIGLSDWLRIDQARIDAFAQATGDLQWIHSDPVRAAAESPFGTTIAHGYLTLSLLAKFAQDTIACDGASMGLNYGLNLVRFTAPVPAGSRVRARFKLISADPTEQGVQVQLAATVEIEGQEKPACVAEMLARWYR